MLKLDKIKKYIATRRSDYEDKDLNERIYAKRKKMIKSLAFAQEYQAHI